MPKISIITPSYNQAIYLEQTIRSVLAQGVPDLEYLVVDGGSRDGSRAIIERYADQLAWWVSEPDQGQAEAINKGFARANGEYIAWLNSDDLYAPGALQSAIATLDANPELGLVFGDAITFDAHGAPIRELRFADWGLPELVAFNIICQPAVIMRRSALEQAGYLDLDYHFLLDHHLWLRIARRFPIQHVQEVWAFARYHSQAKNFAQAAGFGQEALRILAWMETQPDLSQAVQQDRRRVYAMAARFNGRYLLDGGQPWAALRAYLSALFRHPATALVEWHRILFALLSGVGLRRLGQVYYRLRSQAAPVSLSAWGIETVDELYRSEGTN
ncbi:MAG: glycosyltransferase [Anaerolineales bacterium]|nr:glycosyltransferase [Anaerolineales bacterium]